MWASLFLDHMFEGEVLGWAPTPAQRGGWGPAERGAGAYLAGDSGIAPERNNRLTPPAPGNEFPAKFAEGPPS